MIRDSHSRAAALAPDLYLASRSPRRRELLQQIGVRFAVVDPALDEVRAATETPTDYVQRLALDKARAGLPLRTCTERPVLGADTIVVLGARVLEKPADEAEALAMLAQLSGTTHQVLTAVAMTDGLREQVRLAQTAVTFRTISALEARRYWATGEPCDKAGGYAIQGLGAVFVSAIQGSYSAVVGLPIETLWPLLTAFDVPFWQPQQE